MEQHADDVAALLDALDIPVADVVALSMGGYVALALVQLHPDRLRTLALVDTRSEADTAEGRAGRDQAIRLVLEEGRGALVAAMMRSLVAPGASVIVRARVRTMMEGTSYETTVAALRAMRDREDRTPVLGRIAVPTAVIVGEHDAITPPSSAEAMVEQVAGATLHVVEGAGHMAPMESPDAVADVLRGLFERGEA